MADIYIAVVLIGFLAFCFIVGYVVVEIIVMCIEAIIYLMERWKRRRDRKRGI